MGCLVGCKSSKQAQKPRLENMYEENPTEIVFDYKLFHFSSDSSRIFVKVHTSQLLYMRHDHSLPTASVIVQIRDNHSEKPLKRFRITDEDNETTGKTLIAHADIHLPKGEETMLNLTLTDENRNRSVTKRLTANKSNLSNRQNFLILDAEDALPLFNDRVKPHHTYSVYYNREISNPLNLKYYNRNFSLPPPPFVMFGRKPFDYDPDNETELPLHVENRVELKTDASGFYHIAVDKDTKEGITAFVSDTEFPKVTTEENLVGPLRFVLSGKEFDRVLSSSDRKQTLENLWITWAGSKEKARNSIRAYYNRVEKANEYFSSHMEGWKTERGMIYIVYGKPDKVYRTPELETWIYGDETSPMSITYYFIKVINPFTENDYLIDRQEIYKPSWYRSVNAWRDGRTF